MAEPMEELRRLLSLAFSNAHGYDSSRFRQLVRLLPEFKLEGDSLGDLRDFDVKVRLACAKVWGEYWDCKPQDFGG